MNSNCFHGPQAPTQAIPCHTSDFISRRVVFTRHAIICIKFFLYANHCSRCWRESIADTKSLSSRGLLAVLWTFPICCSPPSHGGTILSPHGWLFIFRVSVQMLPLTNIFKVETCSRLSSILLLIFLFFTIFITTWSQNYLFCLNIWASFLT